MTIKGSKDLDSNVVSNENFKETLSPSGWALGQATWAKIIPKLLHLWCHSLKIHTPNQKTFFECHLEDCPIRLSLEQFTSVISGGARALVRQPKTVVF